MTTRFDANKFTATDLRIVLNEIYPEANYGAIPVIDQCNALEAYLAFDDGALVQSLEALAAYVIHEQPSAVQGVRKTQASRTNSVRAGMVLPDGDNVSEATPRINQGTILG